MAQYKWNDDRLKEIYNKAGSYSQLIGELGLFFDESVKNNEVSSKEKNGKGRFIAAARRRAKKLGIVKEHHSPKYSFKFWDKERIQKFVHAVREAVREKTHLSVLLVDFPELESSNIVYFTIQTLIPGGIKRIRNSVRASGSVELDGERDSMTQEENDTLDALLEFIDTKRVMRVSEAAEHIGIKKEVMLSLLIKFSAKGFFVNVPGEHHLFFSDRDGFYEPEELYKLVPEDEQKRIMNFLHIGTVSLEGLSKDLYAGRSGENFLEVFLENYRQRGLIRKSGRFYSITEMGKEFGIDPYTIQTFDLVQLENEIAIKKSKNPKIPKSRKEIARALKKDREKRLVKPVTITLDKNADSFKTLFLAEILYGNQNTDENLLDWILSQSNPDFAFISGLVQGTFSGEKVDKGRTLATEGDLNNIGVQFRTAGLLLEDIEKNARNTFIVQGDDDWDAARGYAKLAQLAEGKFWRFGSASKTLSQEQERRRVIIEFYRKFKIQWETMFLYQYRIGRSLMNLEEVYKKIRIKKSEYRLIIEILVAKRKNIPYPEIYNQVVNVDALFGNIGKRIVTPDPLMLNIVGEDFFKQIQFVHNTNFSNVTQYIDPIFTVEAVMRHLGARGEKLPDVLLDAQQEFFFMTHFQEHWIGTLPGMQTALDAAAYKKETFSTHILSSKSHRQNTFRKSPATAGAPEIEFLKDGRVRFRLLNEEVKKVIQEQKGKPHKREVMAILTDTQHGSITMQPELELKYLDYALFERKADRLYENGDVLQALNYWSMPSENRPLRLVSLDSQLRFTEALQMPLITSAPNLKDFAAWHGNHEWNTKGVDMTGQNLLYPLEAYLRGFIKDRKHVNGRLLKLERAMTVSRIRRINSKNPHDGDIIVYPYFADVSCGFKFGITHVWQKRGKRTPVDAQRLWLRNMADSASDLHVTFGGDKHSTWMAQEFGKWLIQLPASATQSGWELADGYVSEVMYTLVEFDNRRGITVEFIPWQFLQAYKCKSPILRGKDELLLRPAPGLVTYDQGKFAPYIEDMIDNITRYLPV